MSDLLASFPSSLVASTPVTVAELFARRHEKLAEKRVKIAELASGLMEDPETNVSKSV